MLRRLGAATLLGLPGPPVVGAPSPPLPVGRMTFRLPVLLGMLLALAACASPCDRISNDMRQLNADMIRDPAIIADGRYAERFQELAAQSVEHSCLR